MFSLETQLRHHLGYNHFPPVHPDFDAPALRAIELAAAGDCEELLTLPNGRKLTVGAIIDGLHLQDFVDAKTIFDGLEIDPCSIGEHLDVEDSRCIHCGEPVGYLADLN